VLQGVLPTMLILAIYYTIADVVLMVQCFYYRGLTLRDDVVPPAPPPPKPKRNGNSNGNGHYHAGEPTERTGLLTGGRGEGAASSTHPERSPYYTIEDRERRGSWTHLSPAVPFVNEEPETAPAPLPTTWTQAVAFNSLAVFMVCAAGVAGWWLSRTYGRGGDGDRDGKPPSNGQQDLLEFNTLGQVFGWLCAVLYLGSRLPQLLLNWRRKSTEGVSVLFFLFACLGNLTYVLSILAFEPKCAGDEGCQRGEAAHIFWQYILVNLSWLAGSAGTLLLDMGIFVQFFVYSKTEDEQSIDDDESTDEEESIAGPDTWDPRPLLQRNNTGY
jgi:hypothetical protein